MILLYAIKIPPSKAFNQCKEQCLAFLSPESMQRLFKIKNPTTFCQSLLGELLVRSVLVQNFKIRNQDIVFGWSKKGKPYLKNQPAIQFNTSHSKQWVVIAVSQKPIGVDVEKIRPIKIDLAKRFFSDIEFDQFINKKGKARQAYFFDLWTLKESYLKALGKGLTKSLRSFSVINENGRFNLLNNKKPKVYFKQYTMDKAYALSVCAFENNFTKKVVLKTIDEITKEIK
jgi:4'-phosphopantetheinyl transferase